MLMTRHSNHSHEGWAISAASLTDGPATTSDFRFLSDLPHDDRNLPDVELDRLAEAILLNLGREIAKSQLAAANADHDATTLSLSPERSDMQ